MIGGRTERRGDEPIRRARRIFCASALRVTALVRLAHGLWPVTDGSVAPPRFARADGHERFDAPGADRIDRAPSGVLQGASAGSASRVRHKAPGKMADGRPPALPIFPVCERGFWRAGCPNAA